jgi:hypothetical protein
LAGKTTFRHQKPRGFITKPAASSVRHNNIGSTSAGEAGFDALDKRAAEEEKSGPDEQCPPEPLFDLRQIVQLIQFSNLIHGFHAGWI